VRWLLLSIGRQSCRNSFGARVRARRAWWCLPRRWRKWCDREAVKPTSAASSPLPACALSDSITQALRIGALLGETGGSDVVDAAAVVCARDFGLAPVLTSESEDLRKLDLALPLIVI